jgi:quinone-modifying oxidoreductase subunit QmoC
VGTATVEPGIEEEGGTKVSDCSVTATESTPLLIEPDLHFIESLTDQAGESFKKCFQCGTCSVSCSISPEKNPFPRKEMAWARWGMKKELLSDPDVWLCHQCNDCSVNCPRGGRPGDLMAAVRKLSMENCSFPRLLGRSINQPRYLPLFLGFPVLILGLGIYFQETLGEIIGIQQSAQDKILFAYSSMIPHWLIFMIFGIFTGLALIALIGGIVRFWKALSSNGPGQGNPSNLFTSVIKVTKSILFHDIFSACSAAKPRYISHIGVLLGFLALTAVTLWVITARINPVVGEGFVYPFNFWSPWRILANLGGLALILGSGWMIFQRMYNEKVAGRSSYFDWVFLGTLFITVMTGFLVEILHYLRLVPHRHVLYFVHLVFVFVLLIYLPYSKFAHMIYRTVAMVYADYSGRKWGARKSG